MSDNITKRNRLFTAAMVLLIAVLVLDVLLCFMLASYKPSGGGASTSGGGGVGFDPSATDKRPDSATQSHNVAVAGFSKITIPPDTDTVAIDLYNPEENFGLFYMTFELRLLADDGTYEVLYKSGLVAAGKHIYQVTLAHGLEAGEYAGQLFVQPYRMSDMSATNTVLGNITIVVK